MLHRRPPVPSAAQARSGAVRGPADEPGPWRPVRPPVPTSEPGRPVSASESGGSSATPSGPSRGSGHRWSRPIGAGRGRGRLARTGRRRAARRHRLRRWGAALLAALAGFFALSALGPGVAAGPGIATVVAANDLPAGAVLTADDLVVEPRPPGQRPETAAGRADELVGRVLVTPVVAREVVTPSRLRGPGMLSGQPPGTVAMSVPVLDPRAAGVDPGSRVDLYASGSGDRVASNVTVLATRVPESSSWSAGAAASLTLALDERSAGQVARAVSTLQAGEIFVVALRAG